MRKRASRVTSPTSDSFGPVSVGAHCAPLHHKTGCFSIWQKSYHDHIIRTEADYLRIWEYIDTNPAKWREDRYYEEGL